MAVISDKGYVCSAQIMRGLDKETDNKTLTAARDWRIAPARKDGRPVAAVITLEVDYWRKNGKLIPYPESPSTAQAPARTER